jgi:heat shock protein HslJ
MSQSATRCTGALTGAILFVLILAACTTLPPVIDPFPTPVATLPGARTFTMFVGPQLVNCAGVGPQQCLQVRAHPEDAYQLFYNHIVGFTYEPGFTHEIKVSVGPVPNPPAGAPAYSYILVDVVSKIPYMPPATPMASLTAAAALAQAATRTAASTATASAAVASAATAKAVVPKAALPTPTGTAVVRPTATATKATPPTAARNVSAATRTAIATRTAVARITAAAALAVLPLEAPSWQLISYTGTAGRGVNTLPGTRVTAEFKAGKLGGNAGCNSYFGTYQATGATLSVKIGGSTMMACSGLIESQEQIYLTNLARAATYTIANGQLQVADAGGQTLLTYAARPPVALAGTNWQVNYYNNGRGAVVSALIGSQMNLTVSAGGHLSGNGGCNDYDAGYKVQGAKLTIGPIAATHMRCARPPGVMEEESAYLAALSRVATYQIQADRLLLGDAQGMTQVDAVAVPN